MIADARRVPLLTIDLGAVAANTATLAERATGRLMAVVKADGYGAGAVDVARTALAHGASSLGVTSVAEALALRDAGLDVPVLSWLNAPDVDVTEAVVRGVDLAVPSLDHLLAICRASVRTGVRARVHIHADIDMARDGAPRALWPTLCRAARAAELRGEVSVVGVMGHLACADVPQDPRNALARQTFTEFVQTARACGLRPTVRHLAATAATLTDPASHFDLCRVGAGLVGIDPSGSTTLRPASTLTAPVVGVRDVPAGTYVGYGRHHRTTKATRLALLPIGYADGLPRIASRPAAVLLRGRLRPVVGVVSMDQVVVDVGDGGAEAGDVATIFGTGKGGEPTAADWAGWAGTIEHEIVTGIGRRVRRHVRSDSRQLVGGRA